MKHTTREHPNIFLNPDGSDAGSEDFYFNRCIYIIRKVLTTFGTYVQPLEEDFGAASKRNNKPGRQPKIVLDECGGLFVSAPTPVQRGNYMNVAFYFILLTFILTALDSSKRNRDGEKRAGGDTRQGETRIRMMKQNQKHSQGALSSSDSGGMASSTSQQLAMDRSSSESGRDSSTSKQLAMDRFREQGVRALQNGSATHRPTVSGTTCI